MRIWDCHSHCRGEETGEDVLRQMDKAGIERICLFSEYPGPRGQSEFHREDVRAAADHIGKVQAADPSRIYGLLWVEPRTPGIVEEIDYAVNQWSLRGVKMIPDHWYPCDDVVMPVYTKMQELGKPIQFHSGILYGFADSSRFCRPVFYEALVNFPGLRFSLAHVSWPWVDECIAVYGRFRAAAGYQSDKIQMWIDSCRGTPDAWREEALRKAVAFCGMEHVMFGIDGHPGSLADNAPVHVGKDVAILRNLMGLSEAQVEMFFWGAAEKFYGS